MSKIPETGGPKSGWALFRRSSGPSPALTAFLRDYPRVSNRQMNRALAAVDSVAPMPEGVDLLIRIASLDHLNHPDEGEMVSLKCAALERLGNFSIAEAGLQGRVAFELTSLRENECFCDSFPIKAAAARASLALGIFSTPAEEQTCLAYRLVKEQAPSLANLGANALEAIDSYLDKFGATSLLARVLGKIGAQDRAGALKLLLKIARKWNNNRPEAAAVCQAVLENVWQLVQSAGLETIIYSGSDYSADMREEAIIFQEKKSPFIQTAVLQAMKDAEIRDRRSAFLSNLRCIIARDGEPLPMAIKGWLKQVLYAEPLY